MTKRGVPNCNGVNPCLISKTFAREIGPNGVRPRASAARPYKSGCGSAALR